MVTANLGHFKGVFLVPMTPFSRTPPIYISPRPGGRADPAKPEAQGGALVDL